MTVIDLDDLAGRAGPVVPLLRGGIADLVSPSGVGSVTTGFAGGADLFVEVYVQRRSSFRGTPGLTVLVEHSDDGDSWSTAATFTFTGDGMADDTIATPKDQMRVSWTATGGSDWTINSVDVHVPAAGGGGAALTVTGDTGEVMNVDTLNLVGSAVTAGAAGVADVSVSIRAQTRVLTHDEIKALPGGVLDVFAAPPEGEAYFVLGAVFAAGKTGGGTFTAYTGIPAEGDYPAQMQLYTLSTPATVVVKLAGLLNNNANAIARAAAAVSLGAGQFDGSIFGPLGDADNQALLLSMDNDTGTDLGGGHADNTLTITIIYALTPLA